MAASSSTITSPRSPAALAAQQFVGRRVVVFDTETPVDLSINPNAGYEISETGADLVDVRFMRPWVVAIIDPENKAGLSVLLSDKRQYPAHRVGFPLSHFRDFRVTPIWNTEPTLNDYVAIPQLGPRPTRQNGFSKRLVRKIITTMDGGTHVLLSQGRWVTAEEVFRIPDEADPIYSRFKRAGYHPQGVAYLRDDRVQRGKSLTIHQVLIQHEEDGQFKSLVARLSDGQWHHYTDFFVVVPE